MENTKLTRAKVGIILSQPFFATLMMKRQFIEDRSIKTMSTNGKIIKYNPTFVDSLSHDELMGVISHELSHIILFHHLRRQGRDAKRWNIAADYAINPILLKSGMVLPKGGLVDDKYEDMSAEQIYNLLPQGDGNGDGIGAGSGGNGQDGADNDPGGMGGVEDADVKSESELAQAEAAIKQEFAQAIQVAKQAGKLPAGIERIIDEVLQPKTNWREALSRFLAEVAKNDYSFSRPNPRYLQSGFILPSLYNIEMGDVVLIVDTSGSIDEELLNQFAGEMQDICGMMNSTIKVFYVDSKVAGEQDIEPDDDIKLEPKGGGGTDFRPAFDLMIERGIEPKAVVYFTDMACDSFPEEPSFPVLWAATGSYRNDDVPFGEVIEIDK